MANNARERRATRRYAHTAQVTVRALEQSRPIKAALLNLSLGGCLIRLSQSAEWTVDAGLEVVLKSPWLSCRAIGTLRKTTEGGILLGIAFRDLGSRGGADLAQLIAELELDQQPA